MSRYHKKCVRCDISFLATKNMLVCGYCYGNQEDLELAEVLTHYPVTKEFNPSITRIHRIIKYMDKNTCINNK